MTNYHAKYTEQYKYHSKEELIFEIAELLVGYSDLNDAYKELERDFISLGNDR